MYNIKMYRKVVIKITFILALCINVFEGIVFAEEVSVTKENSLEPAVIDSKTPSNLEDTIEAFPLEEQEIQDEAFFSFLDAPQRTISAGLKTFATGMDEFFAEERVFYEKTGSYIRFTADTVWSEGGDVGYKGDLAIKVRLPRTEEKLKLTLESDPDETRDQIDRIVEDSPRGAAKESSYYAGVETEAGRKDKWRLKPGIAVKLGRPVDILLRLRADRDYEVGNWLFRPSQTFFAFKESGFGSDTVLGFDYKLADDLLARSDSLIRYRDSNDFYELSQVFSLIHSLSERRAISYQTGVFGITEPTTHATDYLVLARYRQNIHKDYLFMELIPQIRYRKDNNFHSEHSLTFRLEWVFEG